MAPRSQKAKPSASPKSPKSADEQSGPPVEVLASMAATIYAANPAIGTMGAVSAAQEIWPESYRCSIAPKATSPHKLEALAKKPVDQVKAIVGIENSTRAWDEFEYFVRGHQLRDGSVYRGVPSELRDVCLEMPSLALSPLGSMQSARNTHLHTTIYCIVPAKNALSGNFFWQLL